MSDIPTGREPRPFADDAVGRPPRPVSGGGVPGRGDPASVDGDPGSGSIELPDPAELTGWQHYVLLLRTLDAERAAEQDRTSASREGSESLTTDLERLGPEVIDQGAELGELAARLRLPRPRLTPVQITDPPEPHDMPRAAAAAMHRSDDAAREALEEASRPGFLPNWPPRLRNALIYLGLALPALLVQWAVAAGRDGSALIVLIVIPTVTYLGGLVTTGAAGRVRLSQQRAERSPRLGAVISYGIFPLLFVYMAARGLFA